jgi:SulP family sulfate permease
MLIIVVARSISRFIPGALIAVVCAATFVAFAGLGQRVQIIGNLPRGFPHFQVPEIDWHDAKALFPGALALALLGMLESVAIAKSIAAHTGEQISAN